MQVNISTLTFCQRLKFRIILKELRFHGNNFLQNYMNFSHELIFLKEQLRIKEGNRIIQELISKSNLRGKLNYNYQWV